MRKLCLLNSCVLNECLADKKVESRLPNPPAKGSGVRKPLSGSEVTAGPGHMYHCCRGNKHTYAMEANAQNKCGKENLRTEERARERGRERENTAFGTAFAWGVKAANSWKLTHKMRQCKWRQLHSFPTFSS